MFVVLVFLVGALLGLIVGAVACVRYVRQEMTARIAPNIESLRAQLDHLQVEVNLALMTWHNKLHDQALHDQPIRRSVPTEPDPPTASRQVSDR